MTIENILHEASTVLNAAQRHASELKEVGVTDNELHRMLILIANVAIHGYTHLESDLNAAKALHELQIVKDLILWTAEKRFGNDSTVMQEFRQML
jgi:hypothetical protein